MDRKPTLCIIIYRTCTTSTVRHGHQSDSVYFYQNDSDRDLTSASKGEDIAVNMAAPYVRCMYM